MLRWCCTCVCFQVSCGQTGRTLLLTGKQHLSIKLHTAINQSCAKSWLVVILFQWNLSCTRGRGPTHKYRWYHQDPAPFVPVAVSFVFPDVDSESPHPSQPIADGDLDAIRSIWFPWKRQVIIRDRPGAVEVEDTKNQTQFQIKLKILSSKK